MYVLLVICTASCVEAGMYFMSEVLTWSFSGGRTKRAGCELASVALYPVAGLRLL